MSSAPGKRTLAAILAAAERVRRNESGVSVIELAIVAPVLAIFIAGIGDLGRGFSQRYFLQQAANRTIELARQGTSGANYSHLIPEAATAASVPESNVTLTQWLECSGTIKAFDSFCDPGQTVARFVRINIRSSFRPLFGTAGYSNVQPDGTVRIDAMAALRVQ